MRRHPLTTRAHARVLHARDRDGRITSSPTRCPLRMGSSSLATSPTSARLPMWRLTPSSLFADDADTAVAVCEKVFGRAPNGRLRTRTP
jgi:hypothetical protein